MYAHEPQRLPVALFETMRKKEAEHLASPLSDVPRDDLVTTQHTLAKLADQFAARARTSTETDHGV